MASDQPTPEELEKLEKGLAKLSAQLAQLEKAYLKLAVAVDVCSAVHANIVTTRLLDMFPDKADRPYWDRKGRHAKR